MAVLQKIKRAVRGEVKLTTVALEVLRRKRVSLQQRKERAGIDDSEPLKLTSKFAGMSADQLLAHFRGAREVKFLDDFFTTETAQLALADQIVNDHRWPLLGFGEKFFGKEIQWTRDPLSNYAWPLDYHRDIKQFCGVERCMVRSERAQRNHIGWALRTYLRLIWHELETGRTRFATKLAIIRPALQQFLTDPSVVLHGFPQAGMAHKRATA